LPRAGARPRLGSPGAVWDYVKGGMRGPREIFRALYLDSRNALLADVVISVGGADQCPIDPREVFRPAVMVRASGIVLCHNHPSGDPAPSDLDVALTRRLKDAGELLCVAVLDHVVVTDGAFVSMKGRGAI
jgi:DNA repair protein RadC